MSVNPFTPKSNLIDFTLSNARRFNLLKGETLEVKMLRLMSQTFLWPRVGISLELKLIGVRLISIMTIKSGCHLTY